MILKNSSSKVRPFGIRDKIGYFFGDFGNDFTFLLSSMILLKFYTDIMGVPAGVVGTVMMFARFVDAFTDVIMGRICDRGKVTSAGKFKPWILRMCVPVAISSFLIYQSSLANMPMTFKICWLAITYILWGSVFYTSINIPYGSMASAISPDPNDRQSLSTFRAMGGTLAGVITGIGIPLLAFDSVNGNKVMNGGKVTIIAGIFSILAIICYLICYYLMTERVIVKTEENVKHSNAIEMLKSAIKNRPLISIIVASILVLISQFTMQSMASYVFPNYYRSTTAQSLFSVIMLVGMLIAAGISKPLASKFGKRETCVVSSIATVLSNILLFFLRPSNVGVYIGISLVSWLGLGIFSMMAWSFITDVIDYSEIKNGVREDGTIYALYSFSRKIGQAISAGLTGSLLSMIGYTQSKAFEPRVLDGIYNISVLVPVLGFLLFALVLRFWYPLDKKSVDANAAKLKEKYNK